MYNLGYVMDGMGRGLGCGCAPRLGYVMDGLGGSRKDEVQKQLNEYLRQLQAFKDLKSDLEREIRGIDATLTGRPAWLWVFNYYAIFAAEGVELQALRANLKKTAGEVTANFTAIQGKVPAYILANKDEIDTWDPSERAEYGQLFAGIAEDMSTLQNIAASRDHALAMKVIDARRKALDVGNLIPDMQPIADAARAAQQQFHDIFGESLEEFASKMQSVLTTALWIGGGLLAAVFFAKGLGQGIGSRRSR